MAAGTPPIVIETVVRLPNDRRVRLTLDVRQQGNHVSQGVVDMLSRTGEIVIDPDVVFVELYFDCMPPTATRHVTCVDGAWAEIYASDEFFITLGAAWMDERHATMLADPVSCVIEPLIGPRRLHIHHRGPPRATPPPPEQTTPQSSTSEVTTSVAVSCASQTAPQPPRDAPTLVASDIVICHEPLRTDMIWLDFCRAHPDRQLVVCDRMIYLASYVCPIVFVFIFLRHFKIRGRIFSKWGRLTGTVIGYVSGARNGLSSCEVDGGSSGPSPIALWLEEGPSDMF